MRSTFLFGAMLAFALSLHGAPAAASSASSQALDEVPGCDDGIISGSQVFGPRMSTTPLTVAWQRGAVASLLTVVGATVLVGTEPRRRRLPGSRSIEPRKRAG